MKRLSVLLGLSILAAGCSKENEDRFSASYDKNFRSSCVSSSEKAGVPAAVAAQTCECTITQINKTFSAREKLTMPPEQAKPIMLACLNKAMQR